MHPEHPAAEAVSHHRISCTKHKYQETEPNNLAAKKEDNCHPILVLSQIGNTQQSPQLGISIPSSKCTRVYSVCLGRVSDTDLRLGDNRPLCIFRMWFGKAS